MNNLSTNEAFPELKHHGAFDINAATLEALMVKGDEKDTWTKICENVGEFLATTRNRFNEINVGEVMHNHSIKNQSALGKWIENMNESWDAITSIVPEGRTINLNMEKIRERGTQAAEMMRKVGILNFDNLVSKNVQQLSSQQNVQINFNQVELVYGPAGLDTAIFLADVLVKYHQQLRLEHNIRYITSDCAKSFGRAYDNKANLSEVDSKTFWAQTSLLTGWEIIRRVTEDENLRELNSREEIDLSDVFEAGLRLVYNGRIDNIGFMIIVALAEL